MTEQEAQEHVDVTTSQLAELPDGQISGIVHDTNLTLAGPKRSTVQEVEAPASSSDALQPESPADASEAEDVPLLTNIAASEASSESQQQSESSIPHSSQVQLHSTAQRSLSTTTSQASDTESNVAASLVSPASITQRSQSMATSQRSDFGVGSNLVSAPSIGVQSEQASDGATEATDEDRMSSHAAASTSGVAPQETPNSRPKTARMQGECRQQFHPRQLMCKICLLHGS